MPDHRHTFPKSHHLRKPAEFAAVYDAKTRDARGPLLIYALPNTLGHPRLGLSTSRRVGTAPRRNRIRRMLRETFRLMQHDFPTGYDLVIVVRPHEPLTLADYQRILSAATLKLHNVWARRALSPSPCNQGEGGGEGSSSSIRTKDPLPEYREGE